MIPPSGQVSTENMYRSSNALAHLSWNASVGMTSFRSLGIGDAARSGMPSVTHFYKWCIYNIKSCNRQVQIIHHPMLDEGRVYIELLRQLLLQPPPSSQQFGDDLVRSAFPSPGLASIAFRPPHPPRGLPNGLRCLLLHVILILSTFHHVFHLKETQDQIQSHIHDRSAMQDSLIDKRQYPGNVFWSLFQWPILLWKQMLLNIISADH
jgi:hypothetical protein